MCLRAAVTAAAAAAAAPAVTKAANHTPQPTKQINREKGGHRPLHDREPAHRPTTAAAAVVVEATGQERGNAAVLVQGGPRDIPGEGLRPRTVLEHGRPRTAHPSTTSVGATTTTHQNHPPRCPTAGLLLLGAAGAGATQNTFPSWLSKAGSTKPRRGPRLMMWSTLSADTRREERRRRG